MHVATLKDFLSRTLGDFPWEIQVTDWTGRTFQIGGGREHWSGAPLSITLKTQAAARDIVEHDAFGFLERFVRGEVELEGNLYALAWIRHHARLSPVRTLRALPSIARNLVFQSMGRARENVNSHYDIPQSALNLYLDRTYRAYSCGMFEAPEALSREELVRPGEGSGDTFDSLEKAMWRKFKDAVDFVAPRDGETLLDVGCGYGGQLRLALDEHPFGHVVGWTHSRNQIEGGAKALAGHDPTRWELREGDYREETRVFDHVTSTGMACHVGERGLVPYVQTVRRRIRRGGRYLHHVIMSTPSAVPLSLQPGPAFNKKYVWPGFHWFTLGDHVKALERNGFRIARLTNLSPHYAKTAAAWYERMMAARAAMIASVGEPTFRAWRVYLAGISGSFTGGTVQVNRLYCEAV